MASVFPHGAAAVSLSFDDARPSQLEGVSILDAHGVRATFYVLPAAVAAAPERWLRIARTGHEIGNHTVTHPCSGNYAFARGNALEDKSFAELAAVGPRPCSLPPSIASVVGWPATSACGWHRWWRSPTIWPVDAPRRRSGAVDATRRLQ